MRSKYDSTVPSLGELHEVIERLAAGGQRVPEKIRDEYLRAVADLRHLLARAERMQSDAPADGSVADHERLRIGVKRAIDKALARFGSPD